MMDFQAMVHWTAYVYYLYIFGYAALLKVIKNPRMMDGMNTLGFGKTWTLVIGYAELLGVVGLLLGLWHNPIKNASVLWLFPFAIGAVMVHFAHNDYRDFYDALMACLISLVLLSTDKHFRVIL